MDCTNGRDSHWGQIHSSTTRVAVCEQNRSCEWKCAWTTTTTAWVVMWTHLQTLTSWFDLVCFTNYTAWWLLMWIYYGLKSDFMVKIRLKNFPIISTIQSLQMHLLLPSWNCIMPVVHLSSGMQHLLHQCISKPSSQNSSEAQLIFHEQNQVFLSIFHALIIMLSILHSNGM